jgi:hypothetical protein
VTGKTAHNRYLANLAGALDRSRRITTKRRLRTVPVASPKQFTMAQTRAFRKRADTAPQRIAAINN